MTIPTLFRKLAFPAILFFVLVISLPTRSQAPTGLADSPWPMFRHDPSHTARSPFVGITNPPVELWRMPICCDTSDIGGLIMGSDGTIYVSSGAHLFAVDPFEWRKKWKFPYLGSSRSVPALSADGHLYWGFRNSFTSVNSEDGTPDQIIELNDNYIFGSSPVIAPDGTIYVSHDAIWSFDAAALRWYVPASRIFEHSNPALAQDGTIYASLDYAFYGLSPEGRVRHKWDVEIVDASPAVAPDGTIYIVSEIGLTALLPGGSIKWNFPFEEFDFAEIHIALGPDGTIYVCHGWHLYAVNPDGSKKWKVTPGYYKLQRNMVDREGRIFMCDYFRSCFGYGPDGSLLWEYVVPTDWDNFSVGLMEPILAEDGLMYLLVHDAKGEWLSAFADPQIIPQWLSTEPVVRVQIPPGSGVLTHTVSISSTISPITFTVSITPTGLSWLTTPQSQGVTPASIDLNISPSTMPPGDYEAFLRLDAENIPGSRLEIPITLDHWAYHLYLPTIRKDRSYELVISADQVYRVNRAGIKNAADHEPCCGKLIPHDTG